MNELNRRRFLQNTVALTVGSMVTPSNLSAAQTNKRPLIISTWPFGKPANERALEVLQQGGSTLDAVEQGIRLTEASGNLSVGLSGKPNAAGFAQLDACIMHGPGHRAGSVAAIEGIVHPITAARRVMEKTPHVMLAGRSAHSFAIHEGLEAVDVADNNRLDDEWWRTHAADRVVPQDVNADNHDTIALLVLARTARFPGDALPAVSRTRCQDVWEIPRSSVAVCMSTTRWVRPARLESAKTLCGTAPHS